ncbi:MAG: ABC transporter ATP-binding protein [Candidatus Methylacidiphilales bacterium]|nr:ABC transporter ATP-binding protein [Candidatus Methylacidiphilales bacterium]
MAKVIIEHLYKIYPGEKNRTEKVAVDDAHFEIEDREFMVLVGPSGCGKTTTLRMIAGLEEISKGRIFIDGKVINDVPPKDRDIAMVFQNYALYPHMSVYKNMAFGLELRKTPRPEIERRVSEAARILGLSEPDNLLERKPKALSGGQRQRVALGRAIVRQPKAFLFDEPLSNLDAKMRVEMRTEISKLHRTLSSTMIYVTHDQVEAMTMADRIVVMKMGKVQQIAEPLTIYNEPANLFVAGFIGSPAMNFIQGTITRNGGSLCFHEQKKAGSESAALAIVLDGELARKLATHENKPVVLGLRPENLDLLAEGQEIPPVGAFQAQLEVIEPMGPETYYNFNTGSHPVVARSRRAMGKDAIGRRLTLVTDMEKARFFDKASEKAIV